MDVKFLQGLQSGYDELTSIESNTFYYTTDTKNLYLGTTLIGEAVAADKINELIEQGAPSIFASAPVPVVGTDCSGTVWKFNPRFGPLWRSLSADAGISGGEQLIKWQNGTGLSVGSGPWDVFLELPSGDKLYLYVYDSSIGEYIMQQDSYTFESNAIISGTVVGLNDNFTQNWLDNVIQVLTLRSEVLTTDWLAQNNQTLLTTTEKENLNQQVPQLPSSFPVNIGANLGNHIWRLNPECDWEEVLDQIGWEYHHTQEPLLTFSNNLTLEVQNGPYNLYIQDATNNTTIRLIDYPYDANGYEVITTNYVFAENTSIVGMHSSFSTATLQSLINAISLPGGDYVATQKWVDDQNYLALDGYGTTGQVLTSTGSGVEWSNVDIPLATQTTDGLMGAEDKVKLDKMVIGSGSKYSWSEVNNLDLSGAKLLLDTSKNYSSWGSSIMTLVTSLGGYSIVSTTSTGGIGGAPQLCIIANDGSTVFLANYQQDGWKKDILTQYDGTIYSYTLPGDFGKANSIEDTALGYLNNFSEVYITDEGNLTVNNKAIATQEWVESKLNSATEQLPLTVTFEITTANTEINLSKLTEATYIDWGDGDVSSDSDEPHIYANIGTYTCKVYGVTQINDEAFDSSGITQYPIIKVVIPDSVTSIGNYTFAQCSSLTSVVIPDSVTSIGDSAFNNCTSLTSIVIPDSVTSIGYSAFSNCFSLTSVVISDSVTSIGSSTFSYCSSLTSVVIGDSVATIDEYAFDSSPVASITFTRAIPLADLASITLPSTVKEILVPATSVIQYQTVLTNYADKIAAITTQKQWVQNQNYLALDGYGTAGQVLISTGSGVEWSDASGGNVDLSNYAALNTDTTQTFSGPMNFYGSVFFDASCEFMMQPMYLGSKFITQDDLEAAINGALGGDY